MESSQKLRDEVFKKIGKNILLYQEVEKVLKILLPYISSSEEQDFNFIKEKIKKQTLGNLINRFLGSLDCSIDYKPLESQEEQDLAFDDIYEELKQLESQEEQDLVINEFYGDLKQLLDRRNKLVHNSGLLKNLDTIEGCQNAICELDNDYQQIMFFYKNLEQLMLFVTYMLQKQYGASHPKFKEIYATIKSSVIENSSNSNQEIINQDDPAETLWETTRIVKLLQLAESSIEKTQGMTSLAKAGKFIKIQDPSCTPHKYGVKALKDILKKSDLFEIIETSEKSMVLYKSKASIVPMLE